MPKKGGVLTAQERAFAQHYAMTGDGRYAATVAGYSQPEKRASDVPQRPAMQAEIVRIQSEKLISEGLPAAVQCLISLTRNEKAPAGARVQAAKVIIDRTLGADEAGKTKEIHEMTPDEIAAAIDRLEREAGARARPVQAPGAPDPGVFG